MNLILLLASGIDSFIHRSAYRAFLISYRKMSGSFRIFCCLVTFALVCWINLVKASNSLGTDFLFAAVPPHNSTNSNITIVINAQTFTDATISSNITGNISIPEFSGTQVVVLPGSLIPNTTNAVLPLGIRIHTTNPASVQVFVNSTSPNGNEGTLLFPVSVLGTDHFSNGANNQLVSVMGAANSANVTLLFPNGTSGHFQLNTPFDVLNFRISNSTGSTQIQASSPVAVFLGINCTNPSIQSGCNYLLEQAVPVGNFGNNYTFVYPGAVPLSNTSLAKFRLVNGASHTVNVNISGITSPNRFIVLVPGREVQVDVSNSSHFIQASGPIDVQIQTSFETNNFTQIGLIPNDQFVTQAFFFAESNNSRLTLVALTNQVNNTNNSLQFNNVTFDLSQFQPTADPSFSSAIITSLNGSTIMMNSTFGVAGYLVSPGSSSASNSINATNFGSVIGRNMSGSP